MVSLLLLMNQIEVAPETLPADPNEVRFDSLATRLGLFVRGDRMNPDQVGFLGSQTTPDLPLADGSYVRFSTYAPSNEFNTKSYSPSLMYQILKYSKSGNVTFLAPKDTIFIQRDRLADPSAIAQLAEFEDRLESFIGAAICLTPQEAKELGFKLELIKNLPGYSQLSEQEKQNLEIGED